MLQVYLVQIVVFHGPNWSPVTSNDLFYFLLLFIFGCDDSWSHSRCMKVREILFGVVNSAEHHGAGGAWREAVRAAGSTCLRLLRTDRSLSLSRWGEERCCLLLWTGCCWYGTAERYLRGEGGGGLCQVRNKEKGSHRKTADFAIKIRAWKPQLA